MNLNFAKVIVVNFFLIGIIINFQNCAPPFKTNELSSLDSNPTSINYEDQLDLNEMSPEVIQVDVPSQVLQQDIPETTNNVLPLSSSIYNPTTTVLPPPSLSEPKNQPTTSALTMITKDLLSKKTEILNAIKAEMQFNEIPLLNAPSGPGWAKKANIEMGCAPRGDATPTYWKPANQAFKSSTPWRVVAPWFVIYPGVGHTAKNVRVKLSGIKVYFLKKSTKQWIRINTGMGTPGWAANYSPNFSLIKGSALTRIEPDGLPSYKLNDALNLIHGGMSKFDLIPNGVDPSDIAALFVDLKSQLILDNPAGIDDRQNAKILVSVGADYYPSMTIGLKDFTPVNYVPAAGGSRFSLTKSTSKSHYFATIDPPGASYSTVSTYVINGGKVALPIAQFEANMPPYLFDTIKPTAPALLKSTLVKAGAYATVTLSWATSTDNLAVAGYNIYRNGVIIGKSASTNFKNVISGSAKGISYNYEVRAFDDGGNISDQSNKVTAAY